MTKESPVAGSAEPLIIAEQGSFFVGGRTVKAAGTFNPNQFFVPFQSAGQTYCIEQLYAQFQIPPNAHRLPIVMVHGGCQTAKTWDTTADGREGFQTIFVRRGFAVYVVDYPGRGRSGIPSFSGPLGDLAGTQVIPDATVKFGHELSFLANRMGPVPFEFYPDSQFPRAALDQFLQHVVAGVADDANVISDAIVALLERIGPAIVVTHSQGGQMGWLAGVKSDHVKAIIAYEPFACVFPEGEAPVLPPLSDGSNVQLSDTVSAARFAKLAKIPIQIVWGDHIPRSPFPAVATDVWRLSALASREFVEKVNRLGGDASILDLPSIGINGNTHFVFSDVNTVQIAHLLSDFLHEKGLDL